MADHDEIATLIPWYANDTLDAEDRRRVDEHLQGCEPCRELLVHARAMAEEPVAQLDVETRHVQSGLLLEFLESPAALDVEARDRIQRHLDVCEICRDSLAIVRALPPESPARETETGLLQRVWQALAATVLRPAPALAYLLLLAVLTPTWIYLRSGRVPDLIAGEPIATVGPTVRVVGEERMRAEGDDATPPLRISHRGRTAVVAELVTGIPSEELADPAAAFVIRLLDGSRVMWEAERSGSDFGGDGVLPLVLRPAAFDRGASYEIVVIFRKPGDALDGRTLYRRSIVFSD